MAFRPEVTPKPTGLETKSRQELETLWEAADNSNIGIAGGYSTGQISEALNRLNHQEALSGLADPDVPLPSSDLPYKDSKGRIINYTIHRMRREAAAAIRAKHPEDFNQPEKK